MMASPTYRSLDFSASTSACCFELCKHVSLELSNASFCIAASAWHGIEHGDAGSGRSKRAEQRPSQRGQVPSAKSSAATLRCAKQFGRARVALVWWLGGGAQWLSLIHI
eukprot:15473307-Alexandrium_andersonii.AAC.1